MHFGIKDLIDVLLVAFFLYQTYKLMKSSGTLAIFSGVVSFIVVWILISQVLEMRLMGAILDKFISVGFVVLVILFQDEIRRFLLALGSHRGWKFLGKLFSKRGGDPEKEGKFVAPVVLACMNMARKKTGALIVIQQDMDLAIYEHTGEMFNAMAPNQQIKEGEQLTRTDWDFAVCGYHFRRLYLAGRPERYPSQGYGIAPSFWFRDVIGDRCAGYYCLGGERKDLRGP